MSDMRWEDEPDLVRLRAAYRMLKENPEKAIDELLELGNAGSCASMIYLGFEYKKGRRIKKNLDEAEKWLRLAYEKKSERAALHLGRLYWDAGRFSQAFDVLLAPSNKKYPPAMFWLAKLYLLKRSRADRATALTLLEEASYLGHIRAKRKLALLYMIGESGFRGIVRGPGLFVEAVIEGFQVLYRDPTSNRVM